MKVLFCIIGIIFCALNVSAFPQPKKNVPPQCIDPTFACQDLQSAKLCDTVKPCIHDVWATMSVPDDNDEVCDICKEMVKEARDQLLSNMTQEEIKEVFEGSCKLLPVTIVADACIKVVDEIIPQLVEMLASRMDPTMVCTVSGMCFATVGRENDLVKYLRMILEQRKDTECSECTTMVTDLQTFLKTASKSEVENYLEKACDEKIPKYLCNLLVDSYFPSVYSYVISTDAKTLCSSAGVCPKTLCKPGEVSKFKDELTCEFCEHLIQHVKDLVTANTTAEEFRTALLNFCKHIGKFSDKCTEAVNDYYDMLFDYIRKLDTKGMCTLMGLCNNDVCAQPLIKLIPAFEAQRRVSMIKLQPASRVSADPAVQPLVKLVPASVANKNEMVESNDIFPSQVPLGRLIPLAIFQQDTECAFCKAISFYLEQDLKGDNSKEGVAKALENVCERWVTEFPLHCKGFLNKYSGKFEKALAEGIELEDICVASKACAADDKKSELNIRVMPPKSKDGPFCELCKVAMTEVENVLSNPETKETIKQFADQMCKLLPNALRDDCNGFVNSNIDALIDILQQELQPDNICPALKLCDENSRVGLPHRVKDMECDICREVVGNFREKLNDPSFKQTVLSFLEEGCSKLPGSLAPECKTFVDENIDTIIGMCIQELDPNTICSMLKICPASLIKEKPKKLKSVECELCKEVVGKVEEMVKDKKTEENIKEALEKVCSILPARYAGKCDKFVDMYTETIITLLIAEVDPDMICAALNVCPTSLIKEKPKKLNNVVCELCKEVVRKVEDLVKDNKTEVEIKEAIEEICSLFPSHLHKECKTFVDTYINLIITLLTEEVGPEVICEALSLCPYSLVKEKPKKLNNLECDLCKEVVGKVEEMVKDKKTEEEIKEALDKVCSFLPSKLSAKCMTFVDQYTETLITLLMEEMDPDMICAALKVCPTVDVECQGCQYALHYIQEQLYNLDTQNEIKHVLKSLCDRLPEAYAKNCDAYIDEYGSPLLVLLAQELDPSVCYSLKMCTNQAKLFKKPNVTEDILHPFNMDECSICTTVVDYVDKLLEEDDVDKEITSLAEKVCTVLPSSYKLKCSSMLEVYGPYILQMIGQVANSKEVCQEIDLCPLPAGQVHLLGGNKCTFGPSYWCKSNAHASACKAEMYCKQQAWKN